MPEGNEIERVETYEGPPEAFRLRWEPARIVGTRRGERRLAKANATPEFEAAWGVAYEELGEAGYAWDGPHRVLFWERNGLDRESLAELVDSIADRVTKADAEAIRLEQERIEREAAAEAERRAREAAFIEGAREEARLSLRDRHWSWARAVDVDEAYELLAREDLDRVGAIRLLTLVDNARRNVARSEKKIAIAHEAEIGRAEDPEVQAAAHEAIKVITAFDEDRASIRNDIGWSKATTIDGHVLAGLDRLSVEQTSHALRLLRVHRRQIPDRLVLRIYAPREQTPAQATLSFSPSP